ncbi:MAG: FoF1 ATP synthase subunit a [Acholeplasmataceae bacterium]|nr:FoF1 ATP synthase subunit a [Acholeplasmataceae bacterium]
MIQTILDYINSLPNYFLTSLFLMAVISIFAFFIGNSVARLDVGGKPNLFMVGIISFVDMLNKFVRSYVGKNWRFLTPIALTMAIYVFLSNISGIFALDSPTRYTAITFSLSITAFFVIQITGFVSQSWRHFLGIFKPIPLMFPLNVISEFTPIISMALRLFGNIASGALILTVVYRGAGWFSLLFTPALHMLFDIAFGLIQTLVIVLLTVIFASQKIDEADLEIE